MFSVPDFLDRAKRGAGVTTDYGLMKALGHKKQANISAWRTERVMPDDAAVLELCKLSGDDPDHVLACIHSMRAANDDVAQAWQRIAAKLERGAACIAILSWVALLFVAVLPTPVQATTVQTFGQGSSLYIMLSATLRLAYRLMSQRTFGLLRMAHLKFRAGPAGAAER